MQLLATTFISGSVRLTPTAQLNRPTWRNHLSQATAAIGSVLLLSRISRGFTPPVQSTPLAISEQSVRLLLIDSQGGRIASVERTTAAPEYQTTVDALIEPPTRHKRPLSQLFELMREALGVTRLRFTRPSEIARLYS